VERNLEEAILLPSRKKDSGFKTVVRIQVKYEAFNSDFTPLSSINKIIFYLRFSILRTDCAYIYIYIYIYMIITTAFTKEQKIYISSHTKKKFKSFVPNSK